MRLFDRFDKVYCISLEHRDDRKISFVSQVKKHNLGNFEFYKAVNGNEIHNPYFLNNGAYGLILTNIEILNDCVKNNYKKVLILEDDCYFTDDVKNIDEFFNFLPDDWDMFYLGGNHNGQNPVKINDKILKLNYTFTTHFVAIKETMFSLILDNLNNFSSPIDVIYSKIQNSHNVYCSEMCVAKQINGYSDIENKIVDYHNVIK
jgi:GR25 family glycosyltransferase involved in LPS biosynthesis